MSRKWGEAFYQEKIDRGFRELGGIFYGDSNIAQPMYQLRGTYESSKQMESPELTADGPARDELQPELASRDEQARDDRADGFERDD
jgi:hypothetical protein